MKNILIILVSALLMVNFSACGDTVDNTTQTKEQTETETQIVETMAVSKPYTLNIGDEIKKITPDATVEISQNSEDTETFYTLLIGEAEIARK